jgi:type I restriction enzyme S subunit
MKARVAPLWSLLASREEFGADLPLLTVASEYGVRLRDLAEGRAPSEDLGRYRVVRAGDLVVNRLWARFGAYGVAEMDGLISPAYWVMRPDPSVHPRFLHSLLRSAPYRAEIWRRSKDMPPNGFDLPWDQFRTIAIPVPPIAEQQAIADHLDSETARIDGLVARRRAVLERVAERRRSATDRVFAEQGQGRWPVVRLKYLVRGLIDTLHATAPDDEDGPGFIVGTACIKGGSLDLLAARRCTTDTLMRWTSRAVPRAGDVLLTREAPAGEAAVVPPGVALAPGQRVVLIQANSDLMRSDLIVYSIYSSRAIQFFRLLGRETTVLHLNMADVGSIPIVLPPRDLQEQVASEIRNELARLDAASTAMTRQIELLVERRQALITATVVGQLDVSGLGA